MNNERVSSAFKDRNVLITAGLGFIGSNLALRVVEYGAHVTLVDAMIPEYGGNCSTCPGQGPRDRLLRRHLRPAAIEQHVRGQHYVFHLGA